MKLKLTVLAASAALFVTSAQAGEDCTQFVETGWTPVPVIDLTPHSGDDWMLQPAVPMIPASLNQPIPADTSVYKIAASGCETELVNFMVDPGSTTDLVPVTFVRGHGYAHDIGDRNFLAYLRAIEAN